MVCVRTCIVLSVYAPSAQHQLKLGGAEGSSHEDLVMYTLYPLSSFRTDCHPSDLGLLSREFLACNQPSFPCGFPRHRYNCTNLCLACLRFCGPKSYDLQVQWSISVKWVSSVIDCTSLPQWRIFLDLLGGASVTAFGNACTTNRRNDVWCKVRCPLLPLAEAIASSLASFR
jgi:hypothetical protein